MICLFIVVKSVVKVILMPVVNLNFPSPVHVYLESVSYLSGRRCHSETPSEASDI